MHTVVRVAAILLGAVFVVSGASKVAAGSTWTAQARQMGAAQPVAAVLPGVELVLVAFSVVIARQLVDGRHPPCACFGTWSPRPLGEGHLLRNAGLILLGLVALWPA